VLRPSFCVMGNMVDNLTRLLRKTFRYNSTLIFLDSPFSRTIGIRFRKTSFILLLDSPFREYFRRNNRIL